MSAPGTHSSKYGILGMIQVIFIKSRCIWILKKLPHAKSEKAFLLRERKAKNTNKSFLQASRLTFSFYLRYRSKRCSYK